MKWLCVITLLLVSSCKEAPQVHQAWSGPLPTTLEFGAAFELELHRSWPADWQAETWSLAALAPFEAELLEESRNEAAGRVEVRRTLRLRVHALGLQQLKLGFYALDSVSGDQVAASDLELSCVVQSSLPLEDAGQAEFPAALVASPAVDRGRRFTALALVAIVLGVCAAAAWWRRRTRPASARGGADLWARFRVVQEMPRSTKVQRRAALQAARSLVREFEAKQAWAAPELAQRLAQRFALPRTEAASLLHFLHETESAVFADQQDVLPALDPALDELAEVLRAMDPEEVR